MDNIQDLENQLLTQIRNLLSQINNYVLQLESLNEYEKILLEIHIIYIIIKCKKLII
jgi:hypothetical protein